MSFSAKRSLLICSLTAQERQYGMNPVLDRVFTVQPQKRLLETILGKYARWELNPDLAHIRRYTGYKPVALPLSYGRSVGQGGLEPPRSFEQQILSLPCLPITSTGPGGVGETRTPMRCCAESFKDSVYANSNHHPWWTCRHCRRVLTMVCQSILVRPLFLHRIMHTIDTLSCVGAVPC